MLARCNPRAELRVWRRAVRVPKAGRASRRTSVNDPIVLLKRDHQEVSKMLKQLAESNPGARRRQTVAKVTSALALHMQIEERLVYPLVAERVGQEEEHEAEIEHSLARESITKMNDLVDEDGFGAAVAMVTAGIKHHVKEEETQVFPQLKRNLDRDELAKLGDEVASAKKGRSRMTV